MLITSTFEVTFDLQSSGTNTNIVHFKGSPISWTTVGVPNDGGKANCQSIENGGLAYAVDAGDEVESG